MLNPDSFIRLYRETFTGGATPTDTQLITFWNDNLQSIRLLGFPTAKVVESKVGSDVQQLEAKCSWAVGVAVDISEGRYPTRQIRLVM